MRDITYIDLPSRRSIRLLHWMRLVISVQDHSRALKAAGRHCAPVFPWIGVNAWLMKKGNDLLHCELIYIFIIRESTKTIGN